MYTPSLNSLYKTAPGSRRFFRAMLVTLTVLTLAPGVSTVSAEAEIANPLIAASGSIEALVQGVSSSVVQIVVTGLHPVTGGSAAGNTSVGRGRSIGSGFVIDHGGYIITNAHVVSGAEQVDVIVAKTTANGAGAGSIVARTLSASIVGVAEEWDIALLKVDEDLPPLPLAKYDSVRQGQLVFAFGSPDGLRNSVSMGMVSAVSRQMETDSPLVYIQTDAAINPGNSGGPLVNAKSEVIGINTFIRTASGGSEGLGFALPSDLITLAYPQLREFGRVRRAVVGIATQTVTPLLAEGLHLSPTGGLIVSDVAAGSPAAVAGLRIGDVITAIDGEQVDDTGPSRLYLHLVSLRAGSDVTISGMRGATPFTSVMKPVELPYDAARVSVIDTSAMAVESLAMFGVPYRANGSAGVMVAARLDSPRAAAVDLSVGDVIYSVNGAPVESVAALRQAVTAIGRREAVVLQVAQSGRLVFVAFERE